MHAQPLPEPHSALTGPTRPYSALLGPTRPEPDLAYLCSQGLVLE